MALGRYVVEAVVLEGRSPTELARSHGISRSWLNELVARFRQGGYPALEPGSRRPRSCPHQVKPEVEAAIIELRNELIASGHDAGAQTIAHHLVGRVDRVPSLATIWRILSRHGLIIPEPHKRPRSSFKRFEAELPNEMWQADATHWLLADASEVEILNLIDDHSRLVLASVCFPTIKAADVVQTFHEAAEVYGFPAAWLSDNAAVFSGESRRGKVIIEAELERSGHSLYPLHALPPADLRQSRALSPNPQKVPDQAGGSPVGYPPAVAARRLPQLLQPTASPPRPRRPDPSICLRVAAQSQARPGWRTHPLPGSQR